MRQGFARSIVALVSIALAGCTTTGRLWTGTTETAEVLPQVRHGDRVLLVRDGQDYNCPVTGFDSEYVYGCRDPVLLREIQEVRFRKLDGKAVFTLTDLRPRDELAVTMRSGDTKWFILSAVDGDVLRGKDVEIMISEIDHARVTRSPYTPGQRKVRAALSVVSVVALALFWHAVTKEREWGE